MIEKESKKKQSKLLNDTELQITEVQKTYDSLFRQISHLSDGDVICKTNCKFCTHPIRAEAEAKYEQCLRAFSPVVKLFKDWESKNPGITIPMNYPNIRMHLLQHYEQQEKKIFLREYAENVKQIMNYKIEQDKKFEMMSAALELKLHEIGSNPTIDVIKQADVMTRLVKSMLEITVTQAKLRGEMQSVNIVINKFQDSWLKLVNSQDNDEIRKILLEGLENFQSDLENNILPES